MKSDVVVVGAGHGGLIAGAKLAQNGLKVTIYEKNDKNNLSWDWKDCLEKWVFEEITLPTPEPYEYAIPANFRFFSPNEQYWVETNIPPEHREIYMERKTLINKLVNYALQAGVEIKFNHEVHEPIVENDQICGIKTAGEEHYANLVIDSAGINTPIRPQLPANYEIPAQLNHGDYIYAYRGCFQKQKNEYFWDIYIGHKNKRGIVWVNSSSLEEVDILMGFIHPFSDSSISETLQELQKKYPVIGDKIIRGGQVEQIPVRRPLEKLVGNNYAVIGDAACMTNPLNGSGIIRSMLAGNILADKILEATKNTSFPFIIDSLWPYQVEYNRTIGADQGSTQILKDFLINIDDFGKIDYLFQNKLLRAEDFEAGLKGKEFRLSPNEAIERASKGTSNINLLLELGTTLEKAKKVKKHYLKTPSKYNNENINKWKTQLSKLLK